MNDPVSSGDLLGLARCPYCEKENCCICIHEPTKCSVEVAWTKGDIGSVQYLPNLDKKWTMLFQVFVKVSVKHSEGKNVEACHLRQDCAGKATFETPLTKKKEWTRDKDYWSGSDKTKVAYHDWWFLDSPFIKMAFDPRPTEPQSYWMQAHVFVEESPSVETWWGYAGTAAWDESNTPSIAFDKWRYEKKNAYFPAIKKIK